MPYESRPAPLSFDEFKQILAEVLQVSPDRLTRETYFITDLAVDSIRMAELLLRVEQLGIQMLPEAAWEIQTVGDAYDYYVKNLTGFPNLSGLEPGP